MAATILCVEDEADLRKDIVEELRDAGYNTIEADNGKVALDAILSERPDLVLCDITMPVMDGHTLLEELRANHPDKCNLPFVFLSALADREHLVKGKKLGADDYLTKPVDYELLLATVESRLESAFRINTRQQEQLVRVYRAAKENASSTTAHQSGPAQLSASAAARGRDATTQSATTGPGTTTGRDVEERLRQTVTSTPTRIVAGRIQILGLDEIKSALGERWDRHGEMVLGLIEETIRKRLTSADVYQRDIHDNFTICFAELNEQEAAFKARAIADEVRTKILGKEMSQAGEPLTAEADAFLDDFTGKNGDRPPLAVQGDAHEVELGVEEVAATGDLLGLLTSRLEKAASRALEVEQSILRDIADHSALRQRGIEGRDGMVTPFHFATFDQDSLAKIEALRGHRPASEDLVRDLDMLLIAKVAEDVFRRPPGSNIIQIVNIHFSTIEDKRRLEHLKAVCETLTEPARAALVFNVVEIPPALLPAKVADCFFRVRHFCRAMMAQCAVPRLGNIDAQLLRTPILSFRAWDFVMHLGREPAAVSTFLKQLRQQRLKLLVYGIGGPREAAKLRSLGVDFLSLD